MALSDVSLHHAMAMSLLGRHRTSGSGGVELVGQRMTHQRHSAGSVSKADRAALSPVLTRSMGRDAPDYHLRFSPSRKAIDLSSTRTASSMGITGRASKTNAGSIEQNL